jgi:hypothetical protein
MQTSNRLLLSLEPHDFDALAREMRPMTFKAGEVLYEPEDRVDLFPRTRAYFAPVCDAVGNRRRNSGGRQ